jgi:hypothetical protein
MKQEMTLEQQREEYSKSRFLAMPLAGMIMWLLVAIASQFIDEGMMVLTTYMLIGSIFYLGVFISKFTGEDFFRKGKPKNAFDGLFLVAIGMAMLVFAIAIPFAIEMPESLPLSLGIMTGLMWLPHSWIIQHWVGYFHAICRTVLILIAWYLFPEQVFFIIPLIIVCIYAISIAVFEMRWRHLNNNPEQYNMAKAQ